MTKLFRVAMAVASMSIVALGGDDSGGAKPSPPDLVVALADGAKIEFVLVKPGTFTMGESASAFDLRALHQVTIAKPFYLGRCELTQAQWQAVMGTNPSRRKHPDHPVEMLRWADCLAFVDKLNATIEGPRFFIPSEAQWEYACRAGSNTKWSFGDDAAQLGEYAWYRANCGGREDPKDPNILFGGTPHPVGLKKPNAWGLFDMHGNVSEQCADVWQDDYNGAPTDGSATEDPDAEHHVVRGGSYSSSPDNLRSAGRGMGSDTSVSGMRIARWTNAKDVPAAAAPAPLVATPEMEAKVMAILDTYRGAKLMQNPDARVSQLIALGRGALPVLLRVICDERDGDLWAMRLAAQRALPALVTKDDVPTLVRLMREGHFELESAFARLDAPEAIAAHAALIKDGVFGTALHDAARPHLRDPAIVAACCAWLAEPKYEGDLDFAIAKVAELVGGTGPFRLRDGPPDANRSVGRNQPRTETVPEAAPALTKLLERPLRLDARRHVAAALVRVGERAGIPHLIDVLATPVASRGGEPNSYQQHAAGLQLDSVSGTSLYVGKDSRDEATGMVRWDGNFAEAAEAFRAWWEKSKDSLVFDPATQRWSVR